ncbi:MAG TPA: class I SAM-dependent methyltransferase [Anaerolineae bacterium]|nr:class I SAM-dependent methyltransferase [Anaerolineae bacterium]
MSTDFLWPHLQDLPAFRALLRAVEAKFYQDLLPLAEPALDVGCGDGHFAAVALDGRNHPLAVGIDPDATSLREARGRHAYRELLQTQGSALPFPDGAFATVVSNSVLEHIPEVEPVLSEVSRVLRPGGRFVFCVPSHHFTRLLFFTQLFRQLRLEALARAYERFFNRISRHHHCDGPEAWRARLQAVGIEVTTHFYYFSARAHHALDLGHYLGLPNLIHKRLLGRWVLFPSRRNPFLTAAERRLRPLYDEPLPDVGAYLFFVARKR